MCKIIIQNIIQLIIHTMFKLLLIHSIIIILLLFTNTITLIIKSTD